ncbi:FliC/FljB family flagellin [Providencia rettgeri]|nr:FliC/FljB family flagellin [Providencia rettgeri]
MAQVINTNILSLTTQNNLNRSQGVLGTAIERLSSGSRINSAKDDAAGQAIANRFTANVKGLTQAARNANDGISMAQVAEGAVNEINENLQRIRELTVQGKNSTNSKDDIASIQAEVTERLNEITRISEQTQFNGTHVLNQADKITSMEFQVGANDKEVIKLDVQKMGLEELGVDGFSVGKVGAGATISTLGKDTPDEIKALTGKDTYTALKGADDITFHKSGEQILAKKDGEDTYYKVKNSDFEAGSSATEAKFILDTAEENKFDVGAAGKVEYDKQLETLDNSLKIVDKYRSQLGAFQNRMQSTINNLNNSVNNLSAARSRIQDADFATEVSNMSRGQILQQAGTAVLAQANQVPQGVLSLLR